MRVDRITMLLGCLMGTLMTQSANQPKMTDPQSFYTVKIETHNVAYELRINDIPVLEQTDEASGIISNFPINPWLINGHNTFRIRILPVETSTVDPDDTKSYSVVISGPQDQGMSDNPIAHAEAVVSDSHSDTPEEKSFTIALPYPHPPWAESKPIGKDAATKKKILDKYREFYRLLETRDLEGIMTFSDAKFKEYSKSLYRPDFSSDMRNSFSEEFSSPPGYLIGIDVQEENGLTYEYYHGDRLVSVKNDEGRSIIMYYNDEYGVTTSYSLFFYFDGEDFILIL
ncbi:MAG: hypothetical protein IH596_01800 [Bacteroidales bacterium]|nr:hypothetical protein [Bacteroidales bacterium]